MGVTVDQIRAEIKARLEADDYFVDLTVLDYRHKNIVSEMQNALGGLTSKAGKVGAFFYLEGFRAPLLGGESPLTFKHIALYGVAIEVPVFNADPTTGTGKSAWDIAMRAAHILHGYFPDGVSDPILIDPAGVAFTDPPPNAVAYQVPIIIPGRVDAPAKCATPVLTPADAASPCTVSMTCATPQSAIYWTDDESYPSILNPAATPYSDPFTVAHAATIRAVAYKSGLIASDSALGIYT